MEKEFVTYEQSLALKELGFDEPCFALFNRSDKPVISGNTPVFNSKTEDDLIICTPLYQQAFRWFREKQGLNGIYTMGDDWNNYYWQVWKNDVMTKTYVCSSDWVYETYEEAESACLSKLIEIVKKK